MTEVTDRSVRELALEIRSERMSALALLESTLEHIEAIRSSLAENDDEVC